MTSRTILSDIDLVADKNVISTGSDHHHPNNILEERRLITPQELIRQCPVSTSAHDFVSASQRTIKQIITGQDPRLLVIVGPCSIHNVDAAIEYGQKLRELSDQVHDRLFLVMRTYFEKPRTTTGWRGLINDPYLNNSFCIEEGLKLGRRLLGRLAQMELPAAIEALDPLTPKYLQDLVSWTAIGARTTESQPHRNLSSSLDCAVGFKNSTDGSISASINSIVATKAGSQFINIDGNGRLVVTTSQGNQYTHIILRGGTHGPNYTASHIDAVEQESIKNGLTPCIMVDCSHGNSDKDPANQLGVIENVKLQILQGNTSIRGVMLESNLDGGSQAIGDIQSDLEPGVSVTDACIDWSTTEELLLQLHDSLRDLHPR